jgi:hypothetical protein
VVTCLIPDPKQKLRNSLEVKHPALSDNMTSGTEKLDNIISFKAFTVAFVVASRNGINHTNLEKASTTTKITVLPALLRGNFPQSL